MLKFQISVVKTCFLVTLLGGLSGSPLVAQQNYPVIIQSNPAGASVELVGDYTIIGQTPCHIRQEMSGRFRLKVIKPGYETKKQYVNLAFDEPRELDIFLTPKNRWKAGLRSGILPGWGQFYAERPVKGLIVGSTFYTSLLIYSISTFRYNSKVTEYETALSALGQPLTNVEYERLLQEAVEKGRAADKAFELRKKWTWITTSVFVFNFIDAILFFPKFGYQGIGQTNLHFSLNANSNMIGCFLCVQF